MRTLHSPGTDRTWSIEVQGALSRIQSGAPGKERTSERHHADATAAREYAQKEWIQLKKGNVLANPDAPPGSPRMHRFLGRGYTGALVAANVGGRLLCNRPGETEELAFVSPEGEIETALALPPNTLAWEVAEAPTIEGALLLLDHRVMAWTSGSGATSPLTREATAPASFLSVAGDLAAWYDAPYAVVHDLARGEDRLRHEVHPELYAGHTFQLAGSLSPDAGTLALCATSGELTLVDVASGEVRRQEGAFAMIERLSFAPDGRYLLAHERYGGWTLLAFDPKSGAMLPHWPPLGDLSGAAFDIDPAGERLALAHRARMRIYNLEDMTLRAEFEIDHVVKRSAVVWIGESTLGIRTDVGCASLYSVD